MILIVDDDDTVRMSLGLLLKRAGYATDVAADPARRSTRCALAAMTLS